MVAALRRAIPTSLEPVVLRIAKVRVAQRLYRSVTR
jgi:hypothetical protein